MKERIVVTNSSPLIALERIKHLHLLSALVSTLWIPSAVRQEVFSNDPIPSWLKEKSLEQPLASRMAAFRLGPGEREAIALALELDADELILDDLHARRLATSLGISVIGTLGLLLRAKKRGVIQQVQPLLNALQEQDFHISRQLVTGILVAAGEYRQIDAGDLEFQDHQ